jgi:hypothetical protein
MILRVLTARTPRDCVPELELRACSLLAPEHRPDGLVYGAFGRQREAGVERFSFVTVWRDLTSLYAWIGQPDLLASAWLTDGLDERVEDLRAEHFEILASTIEDEVLSGEDVAFAEAVRR